MGTFVAFASLLLLLLATSAHGIRPDRELQEAINKKKMVYPTSGEASIAHSVNKHCDLDGHCSSGTAMTPLTDAESGAEKQMQLSVFSGSLGSASGNGHTTTATTSLGSGQGEAAAAAATPRVPWYPDMMDIAGMDYSPAARRSPIHN